MEDNARFIIDNTVLLCHYNKNHQRLMKQDKSQV